MIDPLSTCANFLRNRGSSLVFTFQLCVLIFRRVPIHRVSDDYSPPSQVNFLGKFSSENPTVWSAFPRIKRCQNLRSRHPKRAQTFATTFIESALQLRHTWHLPQTPFWWILLPLRSLALPRAITVVICSIWSPTNLPFCVNNFLGVLFHFLLCSHMASRTSSAPSVSAIWPTHAGFLKWFDECQCSDLTTPQAAYFDLVMWLQERSDSCSTATVDTPVILLHVSPNRLQLVLRFLIPVPLIKSRIKYCSLDFLLLVICLQSP